MPRPAQDPFAYCRAQGITVTRMRAKRRFLTGIFLDEIFVCLRKDISNAQARRDLADALLAHPTFLDVSGTCKERGGAR